MTVERERFTAQAQLELPGEWAKSPYRCEECHDLGVIAVEADAWRAPDDDVAS